jgi:predicted nuclease of predicted toxin-antitoxin system
MKILIDMNLSPAWGAVLASGGHDAIHWSSVGSSAAADTEIMSWATARGYAVFTHDLDFGTILAATGARAPSVIQIRSQDPTPNLCADLILGVLRQYAAELANGALVSVDEERARVRVLPMRRKEQ